jgi:DNA-binding NtrC family response regulator
MRKPVVLILERRKDLTQDLQNNLSRRGYEVIIPSWDADPLDLFYATSPDLVFIGNYRNGDDGCLELTKQLRQVSPQTPIIVTVEKSSETKAIAAFRLGVSDYFKQPVAYQELLASICRYLSASQEVEPALGELETWSGFIGEDPKIKEIREYLVKIADTECNVLITGETGTGKERVAELLHRLSLRRENPMICINCAALPESLFESELFGYERGAFTGASGSYQGKLRLAEGGTVFLDELLEISPFIQAKMLRAIENREVFSLGGKKQISLNVRIVAATNMHPERAIEDGTLRRDLYYRLNVGRIHLPPLRKRKADIPLLLNNFLQEMNRRYHRQVEGFTDDVMELLLGYSWPGNIRELKNLVEVMFLNLPAGPVSLLSLPKSFQPLKANLELPQGDKERLVAALLSTNWNKSKAAEKLHWSRMTLYRRMKKYKVQALKVVVSR